MERSSFLGRLSLFAFGCASTQGSLQPQPLSRPLSQTPSAIAQVMSRQELVLLGILVLLVLSLIVIAFKKANKKPAKKIKKR